jgi:hypothetical protein
MSKGIIPPIRVELPRKIKVRQPWIVDVLLVSTTEFFGLAVTGRKARKREKVKQSSSYMLKGIRNCPINVPGGKERCLCGGEYLKFIPDKEDNSINRY